MKMIHYDKKKVRSCPKPLLDWVIPIPDHYMDGSCSLFKLAHSCSLLLPEMVHSCPGSLVKWFILPVRCRNGYSCFGSLLEWFDLPAVTCHALVHSCFDLFPFLFIPVSFHSHLVNSRSRLFVFHLTPDPIYSHSTSFPFSFIDIPVSL